MQPESEITAESGKRNGKEEVPSGKAGRAGAASGKALFIVTALRFLAWLNLIICILGSIWIFRELGVRVIPEEEYLLGFAEKIVNPFGIALSLAVFFQGIFGCVFLLALALIAENTMAVRNALYRAGGDAGNTMPELPDRIHR